MSNEKFKIPNINDLPELTAIFWEFCDETPIYYTYILVNSLTQKPIYVGKGKNNREFDHEKYAKNGVVDIKCDVIRNIWANGGTIEHYRTRDHLVNEQTSFEDEIKLVSYYGLIVDNNGILTNKSYGGDGISGFKQSTATVQKTIEFLTKDKPETLSEQTIRQIYSYIEQNIDLSKPELMKQISIIGNIVLDATYPFLYGEILPEISKDYNLFKRKNQESLTDEQFHNFLKMVEFFQYTLTTAELDEHLMQNFSLSQRTVRAYRNGDKKKEIFKQYKIKEFPKWKKTEEACMEHSKRVIGENNSGALLSEEQIREIYQFVIDNKDMKPLEIFRFLAEKFGVSTKYIRTVRYGERWTHIYEEYKSLLPTPQSKQKCTEEDVRKILQYKIDHPEMSSYAIGQKLCSIYPVTCSMIELICKGKKWQKLYEEIIS